MMLPRGRIKTIPEDFVVEELQAYEPSGEGSHLFLKIEKRGLTTDAAVRAVTRALGIEMRNAGIAGMKDKVAVTTQWVSVPAPAKSQDVEARALAIAVDGVRVLEAKRHTNKLKTGHLRGNRFTLVVRDIDAGAFESLREAFERFGREGVPNAFGTQRFGREGDNVARARAWLTGEVRAPNDARLRRLHFSALQSAVFNAVLEARVHDGTWQTPLLGDVLKKDETGGLFVCTDAEVDRARASQGELCPTGPIVGARMRAAEGAVKELEERLAKPFLEGIDLERTRTLGEGTRRALRLRITECTLELWPHEADAATLTSGGLSSHNAAASARAEPLTKSNVHVHVRVSFVLPKGAYATTVLANAFDVVDGSPRAPRTASTAQSEGEAAGGTPFETEAETTEVEEQ